MSSIGIYAWLRVRSIHEEVLNRYYKWILIQWSFSKIAELFNRNVTKKREGITILTHKILIHGLRHPRNIVYFISIYSSEDSEERIQ